MQLPTLDQAKAALATLGAFLGQPQTAQPVEQPTVASPLSVVPKLVIPDTVVSSTDRVARVAVTLSQPALRPLSWRCLTSNGSAYASTFYRTTEATVFFQPGETVKVVEVPILRDLAGKDLKLDCAWSLNSPPIAGTTGSIRGGIAASTAPVMTVTRAAPADPTAGKKLVFSSTFREPISLDAVKGAWRSRPSWGRVQIGNAEIAPYTDPTTDPGVNPFPIVGGKRVLRAERVATKDAGKSYDYSASMLDSGNLFTFQYGYVETRVRFDGDPASIPAFWLIPASGKWPPEMDIFEVGLGGHQTFQSSIHFVLDNAKAAEGVTLSVPLVRGRWYTVGFDWSAAEQVTYIDGVVVARRPNIFHEPMKVILNVAVGGIAPAPVDPKPDWSSTMTLDYLKVWQ